MIKEPKCNATKSQKLQRKAPREEAGSKNLQAGNNEQSGNSKPLPGNNFFKHKWIRFSNKKTE